MKLSFAICSLFAIASLLAGRSVNAQEPAGAALTPGDVIRVVVWKNPDLSGDFIIAGNGTISHPLYREVQVTGLSMAGVEERIRTFLLKYQTTPQFVLQPLVRIVVGGEVRTPNVYSVPPETTITQAIALAGGTTERASLANVRVIRDRQEIRMDLRRPEADVAALQIRSGDQILVARGRPSLLNILGPVTSTIAATAAVISIVIR